MGEDVKQERLVSLDALRGMIMVLMAVDHSSYFIGKRHPAEYWGISLPTYGDGLSFLTRLITHPCAPGFFFLMGAGMILFAASRRGLGWQEGRIIRFFIVRGFLLVGIEMFFINITWLMGMLSSKAEFQSMGPGGGGDTRIAFLVLSALGFSMIFSSLLLRLGPAILLFLGTALTLFVQFAIPGPESVGTLFHPLLRVLLIPGQTGSLSVMYPILPWFGICCLGMGFGRLLLQDRRRAFRYALYAGMVSIALFVVLRSLGGFGNFHAPEAGWIGFLNLTKYPPSLTFVLLMLGINLVLLTIFEKLAAGLKRWGKPLLIFGGTAFFFYVLHMYVFAGLGFAFPYGAGVIVICTVCLGVLLFLYPICRWYGNFKRRTKPESIWRFF
jgi:uncharacterized membrane protein